MKFSHIAIALFVSFAIPFDSFSFTFDPNEGTSNDSGYAIQRQKSEAVGKIQPAEPRSLYQEINLISQKLKNGKSSIEQGNNTFSGGICSFDLEDNSLYLTAPITNENHIQSASIKLIANNSSLTQFSTEGIFKKTSRVRLNTYCKKNDPINITETITLDRKHSYIFVDQVYQCENSGTLKNSRQSIHCFIN